MHIEPDKIKNILCVRNDRFGEFLLNIPALRALKETFPNSRITLIVGPGVAELAKLIPFIDEILTWETKGHSFIEKLKFVNQLKAKHFDLAAIFNPSKDFNLFTYFAGIPIRLGYARKWHFLLTHKLADQKYLGKSHEVDYNLELVNLVGANTQNLELSLALKDINIDNLSTKYNLDLSAKLIAVHPWTSDPLKQWPLENFQELIVRLLDEPAAKVIVIGKSDSGSQKFVISDARITDLRDKTSLVELAALLKKCCLLISCDSGPMHLAAAVGTTVVAIFRNDIPGKTAKRWGPWGDGHMVIEKPNLTDILISEVLNKSKEILNR